MILELINYTCSVCGWRFDIPKMTASSYGEFVMHSEGGNHLAYLNAIEDSVYGEVAAFLSNLYPNIDAVAQADILKTIFGAACDRANDDTLYQIYYKSLFKNIRITFLRALQSSIAGSWQRWSR